MFRRYQSEGCYTAPGKEVWRVTWANTVSFRIHLNTNFTRYEEKDGLYLRTAKCFSKPWDICGFWGGLNVTPYWRQHHEGPTVSGSNVRASMAQNSLPKHSRVSARFTRAVKKPLINRSVKPSREQLQSGSLRPPGYFRGGILCRSLDGGHRSHSPGRGDYSGMARRGSSLASRCYVTMRRLAPAVLLHRTHRWFGLSAPQEPARLTPNQPQLLKSRSPLDFLKECFSTIFAVCFFVFLESTSVSARSAMIGASAFRTSTKAMFNYLFFIFFYFF